MYPEACELNSWKLVEEGFELVYIDSIIIPRYYNAYVDIISHSGDGAVE